jgi:hypothetical protein
MSILFEGIDKSQSMTGLFSVGLQDRGRGGVSLGSKGGQCYIKYGVGRRCDLNDAYDRRFRWRYAVLKWI